MGRGTSYDVMKFNPWRRSVRADQSGPRAWGHGEWSGAEWAGAIVVDIKLHYKAPTIAGWKLLNDEITAAFAPIGELIQDQELRFFKGGREYVIFGRPRVFDPDTRPGANRAIATATFVALDPTIYAGTETEFGPLTPPSFIGGVTVPITVPFSIGATITGGVATLVNEGTKESGLLLRVDGPTLLPRITLERADGVVQTLTVAMQLGAGEWLDIDTAQRAVTLNGVTSRRGQASGDWPILPTGTHTLTFRTTDANPASTLTGSFRSAWW